jgi:putative glutamine amidotransferase
MRPTPLVGLSMDRRTLGLHPFHVLGEKYAAAVADAAGAIPVGLPSLGDALATRELLGRLDGLLLTGSPSNIAPSRYGNEPSFAGNVLDPERDATTLPLVPLAIELDLPVLAICRGLQEVNVALGGTLHQQVHEVPGMHDHRESKDAPLDVQYAPVHALRLAEDGWLARIAGATTVQVNSLHGQGIATLAPGLRAEAWAADGLVEAARLEREDRFLLAMQWHPEWKPAENPFYQGIFDCFAEACRQRMARRGAPRIAGVAA